MASGQDVVFRALCRDAGLPEPEVEGEERLEDVLRDDDRLRQMLGGIMEVVRQCDEQLDEHGLCQCARYIGQILQRAAEIGTALRRYVEAPEAHICDGGDCGLEPCAETPVHREPGHARTVRPPRAVLRPEAQGEGATTHLIRTAVAVADAAPWRQSPDMDLLKSAVEEYRAALRSGAQGEEDAVRRTWELTIQRVYGWPRLLWRLSRRGVEGTPLRDQDGD